MWIAAVFASIAVFCGVHALRYRHRYHKLRDSFPVPLRQLKITELDPAFRETDTGPTRDAEVHFIGSGIGHYASVSDREAWILSVLAKRAKRLFEFGTATGRTAYLLARNSPPEAKLTTITLPPDGHGTYSNEATDSETARRIALTESRFVRFVYSDSEVEHKIEQLFGDSKAYDAQAQAGLFDLIFVDGSHAYSYVKSDTEKALHMLSPGGILLWHDYRGPTSDVADVYRYLNELGRELPLAWIKGTSLVCYRKV